MERERGGEVVVIAVELRDAYPRSLIALDLLLGDAANLGETAKGSTRGRSAP